MTGRPGIAGAPSLAWPAGILGLVGAGLLASTAFSVDGLPGLPGRVAEISVGFVLLAGLAAFLPALPWAGPGRRAALLGLVPTALAIAFAIWLAVVATIVFASGAGYDVALGSAMACVPTTAFALWLVRRLARWHKPPWPLVLGAAAWGGLVGTILVLALEGGWESASLHNLLPGPGMDASVGLAAGLLEEGSKGLALLLIFLTLRGRFEGVVDGIVYGAAVGLGFNFVESISYMTTVYSIFGDQGAVAAGFQWYARQGLGLFFGHATFTAMTGAGFGVARQLSGRGPRVLAIACGWLGAVAAHFAWDAWLSFFPLHQNLLVLVEVHLRTIVIEGPFTAGLLLLGAVGLGRQRSAIERELAAEALAGSGAVTAWEIPILLSPWRRFRARWAAAGWLGPPGYRRMSRLQAAQLELALARWRGSRGEVPDAVTLEGGLRARIAALRRGAPLGAPALRPAGHGDL